MLTVYRLLLSLTNEFKTKIYSNCCIPRESIEYTLIDWIPTPNPLHPGNVSYLLICG